MFQHKNIVIPIILSAGIITLLYLTSLYHYLLFHCLVEIFCVSVSCTIGFIIWNSRNYIKNEYLQFVGIAYFFIGLLDLLHTLSYKGMNIFRDYDYYANQLWIAARYLESLSLFAGFYVLHKKISLKNSYIIAFFLLTTSIIIISIFITKSFPICFVDGKGLTPFKVYSEYIICTILLISIGFLFHYRKAFERNIFTYILVSLLFTIGSELFFTSYINNYGLSNLIGHYLKLFSTYLVYRAIIVNGIKNPFDLFFRELHQNQALLLEAKKAADASNESKSTFLANMSHEIRTPLNAIIGFSSILEDEELDPQKRKYLHTVLDAGNHLLELLNEILDFSKIEAGKIDIINEYFCPFEMCRKVKEMFDFSTKQKGILISYEFRDNVPFLLEGDEGKIRQILINLTGNAVKFTKTGSVTIVCEYTVPMLKLSVIDTGTGIEPQKLEKIFLPFDQGDSSIHREYGGTGLGLTISQRLANLMNGNLNVQSSLGQGSTFTLTVPVAEKLQCLFNDYLGIYDGAALANKWVSTSEIIDVVQDLLPKGIDLFVSKLDELKNAICKDDWKSAEKIAHEIKGFSGNLNMKEIYLITTELNDELSKDKIDNIKTRFLLSLLHTIAIELPRKQQTSQQLSSIDETINTSKVLIIEDNPANQQLIGTYLQKMKLSFEIASDGLDGLEVLKIKSFDLIILDAHMPRMDGICFLNQFRSDPQNKDIPVLMFTADMLKERIEQYYKAGCTDILSKPLKFETLKSSISPFLNKKVLAPLA